jgi:gamma-glutamyl hercynylcysteine S-oxide synthase
MATASQRLQKLSLLERLSEARHRTDALFEVVRPHALYDRPIAERHRIIFYLGHLEAFDWNLFCAQRPNLRSFDAGYDKLFAFGIDPIDRQLPADQPSDWPAVREVHRYKNQVRLGLDTFLDSRDVAQPGGIEAIPLSTLLHTAIEHRLMHAETLAYMFHRLPYERKIPQGQPPMGGSDFQSEMVGIPAGVATLGAKSPQQDGFGWDNEFEAQQVEVPAFRIDRYMVTNGEYLQFVQEGGYREANFWDPSGWDWILEHGIRRPAFWIKERNCWLYRGMFETVPLPLDWPVYVSQAEASAYARWARKSLPTEAQWHRAAYGQGDGGERDFPWGRDGHFAEKGNFDFARWDAAPVRSLVNNSSDFGVVGMLGNGWEWTSSEFAPFRGFRPFHFYPGYSANFFDGKHFVMKGGSPRTAATLMRRSFRNWFQPHYQYVYSGFRCVSN